MRSLRRALPLCLAASFLLPGATQAAEDTLTQPETRDDRAFLRALQMGSGNMLPSAGMSPAEADSGFDQGGAPRAPMSDAPRAPGSGGSGQVQDFLNFLQNGMQQAYDRSFQDGWKILHTHVKNALDMGRGSIPPGLEFALDTGRKASYERSWKDAWGVLHTTVKTIVQDPAPFSGNPGQVFAAILRLGRNCGYEKDFQPGWKILHTFYKELSTNSHMIPDRLHKVGLNTIKKASYERSWSEAWDVLHKGAKGLEKRLRRPEDLLAIGLECSYGNKDFQPGWKILHVFAKAGKTEPDLRMDPLAQLTLEAGMKASYEKGWQPAYEILRDSMKGVVAGVHSPGDVLRTARQACRNKSFQDGWKALHTFCKELLASGHMNRFQAASLRSSMEASYGKSWQAAWDILSRGVDQVSSQS